MAKSGACNRGVLGKGVADLRVNELPARLQSENIQEVIIALGTDVGSEAAASYLAELIASRGVKASRVAFGLPSDSAIEYAPSPVPFRAVRRLAEIKKPMQTHRLKLAPVVGFEPTTK